MKYTKENTLGSADIHARNIALTFSLAALCGYQAPLNAQLTGKTTDESVIEPSDEVILSETTNIEQQDEDGFYNEVESSSALPSNVSAKNAVAAPFEAEDNPSENVAAVKSVIIPRGTKVKVFLDEEMSSKTTEAGDEFFVTVLEDVMVGEDIAIAAGSKGYGVVAFANDNGGFGRAGLLDIKLKAIEVGDIDVPVRGRFRQEGKNNNGAVIATWMAVGIFSGFVKGKEGYMPEGQELKGTILSDFEISIPQNNDVRPEPVFAPPAVIDNAEKTSASTKAIISDQSDEAVSAMTTSLGASDKTEPATEQAVAEGTALAGDSEK